MMMKKNKMFSKLNQPERIRLNSREIHLNLLKNRLPFYLHKQWRRLQIIEESQKIHVMVPIARKRVLKVWRNLNIVLLLTIHWVLKVCFNEKEIHIFLEVNLVLDLFCSNCVFIILHSICLMNQTYSLVNPSLFHQYYIAYVCINRSVNLSLIVFVFLLLHLLHLLFCRYQ